MTLQHLKAIIDSVIVNLREYESAGDIPVLIDLAEPSVGAMASSSVTYAGMGIDWEHGQFRLSTKDKLVRQGHTYNDIKSPTQREFNGRTYLVCSRCGGGTRVSKDDNFCKHCGQRLQ